MSTTTEFVSIIICTYNRSHLLSLCLSALFEQSVDKSLFEIIVINNNSTDDTQMVSEEFAKEHDNIRVVIEAKQGLCFARNRGYKEATGDYLAYIDDDAVPHDDWIERLLNLIKTTHYDAIGGVYLPWYKDGKPQWMKDSYVSNKNNIEMAMQNVTGEFYFCGGNFLIKKNVLIDLQGFSIKIGMTGYKVGYGQEDELQVRIRKRGYHIGFDDKLVIDHYVAPYKHSYKWFVKSKYCKGRDSWLAHHQTPDFKRLMIYLVLIFYKPIVGLPDLLNVINPKKQQHPQNFIIEKFGVSAFYMGRLFSGVKLLLKDERISP